MGRDFRSLVGISGRFWMAFSHPGTGHWWKAQVRNGVTFQGADYLLGSAFKGATAYSDWRIGLIASSGFTGVDPEDTHGSHPTWIEFAGVSGSRPAWTRINPAVSGSLTPTPQATLSITVDGEISGAFLANRSPLGDVSSLGILYCTAVAAPGVTFPVTAGGTLTIGYSIRARV